MFNIGPNTFWLDLHGLLMFLILIFSAFLFGAIFFAKDPDERLVRRLKISSVVAFVLLMLLMITGFLSVGFQRTMGNEVGFDPRNLTVISLDPMRDGYSGECDPDCARTGSGGRLPDLLLWSACHHQPDDQVECTQPHVSGRSLDPGTRGHWRLHHQDPDLPGRSIGGSYAIRTSSRIAA